MAEKLVFKSGLSHGTVRFTIQSTSNKNVLLQTGGDDDCVISHMKAEDAITLGQALVSHGVKTLISNKEDKIND